MAKLLLLSERTSSWKPPGRLRIRCMAMLAHNARTPKVDPSPSKQSEYEKGIRIEGQRA